jgi:hypothetical protein
MSTVTALARKNPDSERGALREAILAAAKARQEMAALESAVERSVRLVSETRRKFEVASKAVAAARDEDVQQLAAAITSGETVSPQATRRAQAMEAENREAIALTRAAVARLENDLKNAEDEAKRADKAVDTAIRAVVAPARAEMLAEAKAVRARYLVLMAALAALGEPLQFSISDAEHRQLSATVGRTWRDALSALRTDPDAPFAPIE